MSEYKENEPQKIDLTDLMLDVMKGIRKLGWFVVLLATVFGLKAYFNVSISYVPQYVASATMAVGYKNSDADYINSEKAEQMAEIFPYIMQSGVLQTAIAEDMGLDYMPGSISMTSETGTNFFTVSANANDPELAYELLQATLRQYPEVAKFVIGDIQMEILDETGIPSDTGSEYVFRESVVDGAIKGGAIGLAIMLFYILTRRTVKSRKDLKNVVNLEDFGSVPHIIVKKRKKKGINRAVNLINNRVSQVYLEAIRKLRIKVLKEMERNGYHSLMVTSSIPGEGKTTLATNLAITFAKQGKKVILIDCDPRNPSVAENMNEKERHPGIASVIRGEISIDEALSEVEGLDGKLRIMYGGRPNTKAARLLGTAAMGQLIETVEKKCDILILDTAPAELLADASTLAKFVDAALYVVKYDYAKKTQIRDGVQALSMSGTKILGCVFNSDRSKRGSGYGYGYKRYGNYGYGYGYGYYGNRKKDDLSGRVIKD